MSDPRFLKCQEADGVHFLPEGLATKKLKSTLSSMNHGSGFPKFTGKKAVPLIKRHYLLKKKARADEYVVAPKPLGTRCLLWVDLKGQIILQNEDNHLFKIDEAFTNQLTIRKDTILDCVAVIRKIMRDGTGQSNGEPKGILTFVIMDATRVYGRPVKSKTLQERISIVEAEIMQHRMGAVITTTDRVFDVDIAKYEALSHMEVFLDEGFQDIYEYPIGSFLFKPLNEPYSLYQSGKFDYEWDAIGSEEFIFLLKTYGQRYTTGHLRAICVEGKDVLKNAATIELPEEVRTMNDKIIECRNVNGHWFFVRLRNDLERPNVLLWKPREIVAPVSRKFLVNAFRKMQASK